MKAKYIAPITEKVIINVEAVLQGGGLTQDSMGSQPPEDVDANSATFDMGEDFGSSKGIWED